MILSETPYPQIYETMCDEAEKVRFRFKRNSNKVIKDYFRCPKSTGLFTETYTVPASGNTYCIWYDVTSEKDQCFCDGDWFLVVKDRSGRNMYFSINRVNTYLPWLGEDRPSTIFNVYDAHFVSRYRQRMHFGQKASSDMLMARFACVNEERFVQVDIEKLNLKSAQLREIADFRPYECRDGVCFATVQWETLPDGSRLRVHRHNTFLSREMLFPNQKKALLSSRLGDFFFDQRFPVDKFIVKH